MSDARLNALFGGRYKKTGTGKSGRGNVRKRGSFYVMHDAESNTLEVCGGKLKSELVGSFQGKQGSLRRSNKGRTYRAPNGSRRYIADWENTAVAYLP